MYLDSYAQLFSYSYLLGQQSQQSVAVRCLPKSSPSSSVLGSDWCRVSGRRRDINPPMTSRTPMINSGSTSISEPYEKEGHEPSKDKEDSHDQQWQH